MFVFFLTVFLILLLVFSPYFNKTDFDKNLSEAISGYKFSLTKLEADLLIDFFSKRENLGLTSEEEVKIVLNYFNGDNKNKRMVEIIIAKQIKEVLAEEGFFVFPMVSFSIRSLPGFLVISPKDVIRREKEIHVIPDLSDTKKEEIEAKVDALGVSSFITDLSGTSTFPIVVSNRVSLRETIGIVAHEWVHQYLFFHPLGFRYALHFLGWKNDDIATINEAAADIVEEEIGEIIYNRYYLSFENQNEETVSVSTFDFRSKMQKIRQDVDGLLLLGKIEEAERYMEEQRLYINSHGFNIRKLNQAYFAFNGTYPSISVNPLTDRVKDVREKSDSLKDFLDEIGKIRNAEELLKNP
jgi:hypothetical protein